jgi:hypothetical protein
MRSTHHAPRADLDVEARYESLEHLNSSTAISAAAAGAPGTSTVTLADLARTKPAPLEGGMEEQQQQQQQG